MFQSGDTRALCKFLHSLSKKYRNYENKRSKRNLDMEREARHAQRAQMEPVPIPRDDENDDDTLGVGV